jgi:hypothetical protein
MAQSGLTATSTRTVMVQAAKHGTAFAPSSWRHPHCVKCAKMERPVNSDRHFAFRETQKLDRLTAFRTDCARRITSQIERVIADFNRAINDLNRAIEAEQIRTRIDDPNHYAYSTAAQAMIRRRSNLIQSIDRLKRQLAGASDNAPTDIVATSNA